jgi:uncharacterized LabA/DUF88 family protein
MGRRKNAAKKEQEVHPPPVVHAGRKGRGKTLVAVDLANLYCQIKSVHGGKSTPMGGDYSKLKKILVPDGDDCTLTCFAPITNPMEDRDSYQRTYKLHNMLRYYGFMVYTTERRNGKADVDVQLAVKAMEMYPGYDCFMLVSADGDFEPLLVTMRESGVKVVVASVEQYMSVRLKMNSDEIVDLHEWAAIAPESDNSKKERLDESYEAAANALAEVCSHIYEMGKIFDDRNRRRLGLITLSSSLGKLMSAYGMARQMVHRGIAGTLKDCLDTIGADGLDREDTSFVSSIVETLKTGSPSVGINEDIRSRFASRRVTDEA